MQLMRGVIDPELGSDIVELGMAKGATVEADGRVVVDISLTTAGCPLRSQIQKDVKARIASLPGVTKVKVNWGVLTQPEKAEAMAKARLNVSKDAPDTAVAATTKVLLIASGKGGVGKSSITVNLAAGIAAKGFTVGILDADIWGYSVPRMAGVDGELRSVDKQIMPIERAVGDGLLKVVSMGHLVEGESTALMWRGLMLNRAVQHFLQDVRWGELDYLLIDMPPGTGDVQMGVAKMLPRAEMIIVTTPALAAQKVAERAASMGRNNYLRIVGVVENMTAFIAPDGERHEVFGRGGGEALAATVGVPLLAQIPLEPTVSSGGDAGEPIVLGAGPGAEAFRTLADHIVDEAVPPVEMESCSARMFDAVEAALDDAGLDKLDGR